jgi:DNA-binding SARP family transcriptional activator/Tfp pilus assembly protein PilF
MGPWYETYGMRFRILGPLEVCGSDGELVSLRASKQRTLLLVLLLRANATVSIGRLEAALWPDRPPPSSDGVIRTYVSGLRAALGLGGAGRLPGLAKEPGGYRLALAPGDLDLDVYDDLSARGRDALARGDAARAAQLLADALALWRGEPGADVTLGGESAAILADVAERRVAAEEAWADARLLLGGGPDLIARLRMLVAEQPLRERAHAQLMQALYRAGRKTEALAEFRALRSRMASELGIEPSAQTRDLHQRILADKPALAPAHEPELVPRQLPGDVRDFTGREATLAAMKALLPGQAAGAPVVIAITGMAGAGKTALAVHFAHLAADGFPDGQLFVDLRGHAEAEPKPSAEALRGFLRALGVREVRGDTDEAAALYRSMLAGKRMIVVLDNAADTGQVRPLLPGSAGCLVLITSRSRLPGLVARDGARPVVAGPLSDADGAVLLRKILGASRVESDPSAAAAIVERCARLPLALRIAAERAAHRPQLALAALAGELGAEQRGLDALTIAEDADTSVRSVFSWSYSKLEPNAARMFRLLGLHPGPDISMLAATALAGCSAADTARLLGALADEHLLSEADAGRYRFHDLLRAYAAERAAADEPPASRTAALQRVLTWYLHTADAADRLLAPMRAHVPLDQTAVKPLELADYDGALAWCEAEYPNLMAAVQTAAEAGEDAIAWKLAVALTCYLEICRPWAAWVTVAQTALKAAQRAGDPRGEAWLLNQLGHPYAVLGRFDEALDCLQRALHIRRETGDLRAEGSTLNNIGMIYGELGRFEDSIRYFQNALDIAVETGDQRIQCIALLNLGETHQNLAQHDEAATFYQRALRIARDNDDPMVRAIALTSLGETSRALRQPAAGRDHLKAAITAWQRVGDRKNEAETQVKLGDLLSGIGEDQAAHEHWRAARAIFEELGDPQAHVLRRRHEL